MKWSAGRWPIGRTTEANERRCLALSAPAQGAEAAASSFQKKEVEEVSTDEIKTLPEDADKASGYDALRPLDIVQEELDPPVVKTEGLIRDPAALPPDEIVAAKDSITRLQQDLRNWPRPEREVFELYFVEGLEPEEIAMVTRQPLKSVRKTISSIQDRLREEMLAQEAIG